jgi:hypothetical protein
MFIATNRFKVAKGSEAAFEHVWLSRDSHLKDVPGFVEFTFKRVRKQRITLCMLPTRSGKIGTCFRLGLSRRHSGLHIVGQGTTSRSIWNTRILRDLTCARRLVAANRRAHRNDRSFNGS